jgi:hypothetical protein
MFFGSSGLACIEKNVQRRFYSVPLFISLDTAFWGYAKREAVGTKMMEFQKLEHSVRTLRAARIKETLPDNHDLELYLDSNIRRAGYSGWACRFNLHVLAV